MFDIPISCPTGVENGFPSKSEKKFVTLEKSILMLWRQSQILQHLEQHIMYIHRESKKTRHQTLGHNFTNYYPIFNSVRPILRIGEYSLVALQHRRIRYIGLRVSADADTPAVITINSNRTRRLKHMARVDRI